MNRHVGKGRLPRIPNGHSVVPRQFAAVGVVMLLGTALAVATDVVSDLMPAGWLWLRQPVVMWPAVAVLTLVLAGVTATHHGAVRDASSVLAVVPRPDRRPDGRQRQVTGQQAALDRWGLHPPGQARAPTCSNLPPRNPYFTGRARLLDSVRRLLSDRPAAVAIQGLGGIGKSQLALEYAHRSRNAGTYEVTWWLRAKSPLTLTEDLAALAPALGVPASTGKEETLAAVRAELRRRGGWLLIFDNALDPDDLREWLPGGDGHVIITSRNRGWGDVAIGVNVPLFTRTESVRYLRSRVGRVDPAMHELSDALGDLPLALAQAASYVDRQGPSSARYLELYRHQEGPGRLLAAGLDGHQETVATTWLIHFEELAAQHPAALQLLHLCSHLDPDDIDLSVLLSKPDLLTGRLTGRLAAAARQPQQLDETIGALTRTGLLTRLDDDRRVRLHRLVSQVTRRHLATHARGPFGRTAAAVWAGHVAAVLDGLFPEQPREQATWPQCAALAPHVATATELASCRRAAAKRAAVLGRLGIYLKSRGDFAAARRTLHQALAIGEEAHPPGHPSIALTLVDLGNVHRHLGEFALAHRCQQRALSIFERAYGPGHPTVAHALGKLGVVQRELGDLATARDTQLRALSLLEAVHGPRHIDVARALSNLGNVYHQSSQFVQARDSIRRALAILVAEYGDAHPEVARVLSNLGLVYQDLGDLDAAFAAQERALEIFEAAYGPGHPDVARTLTNLGSLQHWSGNPTAAEATLVRAIGILQDLNRCDHPDIARVLTILGQVRMERRDTATAGEDLRRALAVLDAAYGPTHPEVADALVALGKLQLVVNDLAAADRTLCRAFTILNRAYGSNHPRTGQVRALIYTKVKGPQSQAYPAARLNPQTVPRPRAAGSEAARHASAALRGPR